ncbi:MAG: DUF3574 domain-containing protein [Pseudolabrys sp.]
MAQTPACTPPLQPMLRAEMYFGRNTNNRRIVNDREWARFVAHELTPHFPDGLTVFDGWGHWRHGDTSVVSREHSKLVIIVTPDVGQVRARLAAVAEVYKQHFEQQSVGDRRPARLRGVLAMTVLKWLLIIAVLGYGGVLALMYAFQRALLYFPNPARVLPATAGLPRAEEVTFQSDDGEHLLAWYVPARDGKPVVLYFQGNAEGLPARAGRFTWLTADGTGLLALCYRGYGGSSGTPSEDGLIRDTRAAYDFASARYPASRIVLFGESLGTGVAVALAAERKIAGLIPRRAIFLHRRCRRRRLSLRAGALADERPISFRPAYRTRLAPLLVLHGEQDRIVPIRFGEKLFCTGQRAQAHGALFARRPRQSRRLRRAKMIEEFLAGLP